MNKFLIIGLCTIATILVYLATTSYPPPLETEHQVLTEPPRHRIDIVHQGYGKEYGSMAADMEKEDIEEVEEALDLIKRYSPEDYEMVINYVEVIELVPISFEMHQSRIFCKQKKIQLVTGAKYCRMYCDEPFGYDLTRASTIVHEACHSMRYHAGIESALKYNEDVGYFMKEEEVCQGMQNDFMDRVAAELRAEEAM